MEQDTLKDKIRGCLMAGAAGDALGYEVEFMSRCSILSRFGDNGITAFALDSNGKALISDDTLELSHIIIALADDLTLSSMYATRPCMPNGTSEDKQWYDRYVKMKPAGITEK